MWLIQMVYLYNGKMEREGHKMRCRACDQELTDDESIRKEDGYYLDLCNECFNWRENYVYEPEEEDDE